MILFLDFDGVLHPWPNTDEQEFSCLPRLMKVLAKPEYARLEVVISSTWRYQRLSFQREVIIKMRPLEEIRMHFPEEFRDRIVDSTPYLGSPNTPGIRMLEIEAWLGENDRALDDWVALDDIAQMFDTGRECPQLLLIDGTVGFSEMDEDRLRVALDDRALSGLAIRPDGTKKRS